jgi:ABC-type nitrate/sulfonate/bicarbonate transport system permease component
VSAVIPIAISLLGRAPAWWLGVVTFGSVWPTLLATVQGFANVEPRLQDVPACCTSRPAVCKQNRSAQCRCPIFWPACALSLTIALILAVIGEMLSGQEGLGSAVLLAARAFRAADLYAGLILLGLVGLTSSYGLIWVERRATRWRQAALSPNPL